MPFGDRSFLGSLAFLAPADHIGRDRYDEHSLRGGSSQCLGRRLRKQRVLAAKGQSAEDPLDKIELVKQLLRQVEEVGCTQRLKASLLKQSTRSPRGKKLRMCINRTSPYNCSRDRIPGIVFDDAT